MLDELRAQVRRIRRGQVMTPLLSHAVGRSSVDMPWGDLEEELSADFADRALVSAPVAV